MKYVVSLNGKDYEVDVDELNEAIVSKVSDTPVAAPIAAAPVVAATPVAAPVQQAAAPVAAPTGTGTAVKAPMPGTILKVNATQGQAVKSGDVLFILEAMKMENEIVSPIDGTVSSVVTSKGSTVATDDALAFIN